MVKKKNNDWVLDKWWKKAIYVIAIIDIIWLLFDVLIALTNLK